MAIAITFVALGCFEPESRPEEHPENRVGVHRPSVLFVFVDQLRADVIGAYGGGANISTPNIDRLAEGGTLFTNGLSTTLVCTP